MFRAPIKYRGLSMDMTFDFEVVRGVSGLITVFILGNSVLGGAEAQAFSKAIDEELSAGVKKLIIDISRVELINSSGLGMLVSAHTAAFKRDAKVVVAQPNAKVMNLLKVTHLNKVFTIAESIEEANAL